TDTFTPTGALATARMGHSATLLDDGRVLVAGGTNTLLPDYLAFLFGNALSTEIWDPNTGTFSAGPNLDNGAKMFHTATRLNNGNILFAGGFSITFISGFGVAEITNRMSVYDQQTNSFIANPFRIGGRPRAAHSAVLLDDGRVLLAGGASQPVETAPTTRGVDVYDPVVDNGAAVADMSRSRGMFPMFKLNDGRVVALGGVIGDFTNTGATNRIDIYDPVLDTWTDTMGITDMLSTPRAASSGIRLSTGRILVIGGQDGNDTPQLSAELFLQ
ncbi:MAG: kelch repeat-containing protein, partial [Planctomycetota bacterium]